LSKLAVIPVCPDLLLPLRGHSLAFKTKYLKFERRCVLLIVAFQMREYLRTPKTLFPNSLFSLKEEKTNA
jgi:hypothetical protein